MPDATAHVPADIELRAVSFGRYSQAMPDRISDRAAPTSEADEPRWPALLAVVAVAGLYAALPASLSIRPRWLPATLVCLLLIPTVLTHRRGNERVNQILGQSIAGLLTAFMIWSVVLLMMALPAHTEAPITLLRSAAALWFTNVIVFALWYWRLDGGGPHHRRLRGIRHSPAFLFPQMAIAQGAGKHAAREWAPIFVDYLFLAFNTSTAFSPTDSPILSRWAKVLTMTQAIISLSVIAILAARAVNIL